MNNNFKRYISVILTSILVVTMCSISVITNFAANEEEATLTVSPTITDSTGVTFEPEEPDYDYKVSHVKYKKGDTIIFKSNLTALEILCQINAQIHFDCVELDYTQEFMTAFPNKENLYLYSPVIAKAGGWVELNLYPVKGFPGANEKEVIIQKADSIYTQLDFTQGQKIIEGHFVALEDGESDIRVKIDSAQYGFTFPPQKGTCSLENEVTVIPATPPTEEPTTEPTIGAEWITVDGIEGGQIEFDFYTGTIINSEDTITKANIPSVINGVNVTTIGEKAFANCNSLTDVTISNKITSIHSNSFSNCVNIKTVSFKGSKQQWTPLNEMYKSIYKDSQHKVNIKYIKACNVGTIASDVTISNFSTMEKGAEMYYGDIAVAQYTGKEKIKGWKINDKVVSVSTNKYYSFYLFENSKIEPVFDDLTETYISVGEMNSDSSDENTLNLIYTITAAGYKDTQDIRYGVVRSTNENNVSKEAVQSYLNGTSNTSVKEYTDNNVMNGDGRYNYIAVAPKTTYKTLYMMAWIQVDDVLYVSDLQNQTPSEII